MPNRLTLRLQGFVFTLALCLPACAQVVTRECAEAELPEKASPAAALAYLKGDRPNLSSACVIRSIQILNNNHYKPAVDVLVSYLDFKAPVLPGIPYEATAGVTRGLYPAADALGRFDESAVPALTRAVTDDEFPAQGRVNAAKVLFGLKYHDKPEEVIRLSAHAARATQGADAAEALQKEAEAMVRLCPDNKQQKCQEALNDQ